MTSINDLNVLIENYKEKDKILINKAYNYASAKHHGQKRQSGEDYITHPLSVACILASMNADSETLCAALLHDTLEDTKTTKDEIENEFNATISYLVDGVTKLTKSNFTSKEARNNANLRKILRSVNDDIRVIIIKLADRLHNMRTIEFKSEEKIKENALETLDVFVPLAYYIGANRIRHELEDISFMYINKYEYEKIKEQKQEIILNNGEQILEMLYKIESILSNKNIPNKIKLRTKNIYGIYKKMNLGNTLDDIYDLFSLKVIVDEIYNCYISLGLIHAEYRSMDHYFKDYIANPKTNLYQSLHTTLFSPSGRLVQTQIRTFDMDKVDSFGLIAFWEQNEEKAREIMQEELRKRTQFYQSLKQIDLNYKDDTDFINQIKKELFTSNIYVFANNGKVIELPSSSSPLDLANKLNYDRNELLGVIVNDKYTSLDTKLQNKDRVILLTKDNINMMEEYKSLKTEQKIKNKLILSYSKDY